MDVYACHPETGEYLGTQTADQSPLDPPGTWLVPAHATTAPPPDEVEGQARVFSEGAWTLVSDHRGETWWTDGGAAVVVDFLGDPAGQGLLQDEPSPEPVDPPLPSRLEAIAGTVLRIEDGFVEGIEDPNSFGFFMAFAVNVGLYWLFFVNEQPDTNFLPSVTSSAGTVNARRATTHLEIEAPADPVEISVQVFRVK